MKKLYTETEFNSAKGTNPLPLECEICKKTFFLTKRYLTYYKNTNRGRFCGMKCTNNSKCKYTSINSIVKCDHCGKEFSKTNREIAKSKHNFCDLSCACSYRNLNKTTGNRRSKLEIWIESQLLIDYPDLKFEFNSKKEIKSELDIYSPKFKLAFELNGVFHYEPIYGSDKLEKIQNNDHRKFQACLEKGIELCIIDTSGLKYFKPDKAFKYYKIIQTIINQKVTHIGIDPISSV